MSTTVLPRKRTLSRRKRLLFQFLVLVAAYGLMELVAFVYLTFGDRYLLKYRHHVAQGDPFSRPGFEGFPMMIHPYIGTVFQPKEQVSTSPGAIAINQYGFQDSQSPIRKRGHERVIVGLLGGSVARQMGRNATDLLQRELSQIPNFRGRSIEFVRLAIDGNKQPQHLMTMNYLLSQGAEFDILINLDGVNEIALPGMDNVPFGVSVAYPRKWQHITSFATSVESTRLIGLVTYLRVEQRNSARWFDTSPVSYSPTAALFWGWRNDRFDGLINKNLVRISEQRSKDMSYCSSGPHEKYESDQQLLAHCVDIWSRSSVLLHQLCAASQIRYFHFLQPNQHLPGSKQISPDERLLRFESSRFAQAVKLGYPLMRARAADLARAGVVFTDLTQVFFDHPEPIYRDDCCHVSEQGDQIMATAIGRRIREWYEAEEKVP